MQLAVVRCVRDLTISFWDRTASGAGVQRIDEARQRYRFRVDGSLHTMTALLPAVDHACNGSSGGGWWCTGECLLWHSPTVFQSAPTGFAEGGRTKLRLSDGDVCGSDSGVNNQMDPAAATIRRSKRRRLQLLVS